MANGGASVGSILSGAFRLFKEQPVTVAIWIGIFVAYGLLSNALLLGGFGTDLEALRSGQVSPASAIGAGLLGALLGLLFFAVMSCAIFRAILRPEDGGFAWLKFGMDEFRMMGLYLILIVVGGFFALIAGLVVFFMVGGAALAAGAMPGAGTVLFMFLFMLLLFVGLVYVLVRLSLVGPLTFLRRRIAIDDGWALSRGNFWKLFLVYLVLGIIMMVLQMVVPSIPGQPGFMQVLQNFGDPDAMQAMQQVEIGSITIAAMLPYVLIASIVQAIAHVLNNGAISTAVRELLHDEGEVLDDEVERTGQIFE
jgi:hypothetical protein